MRCRGGIRLTAAGRGVLGRMATPVGFVLVGLCFLLPFATAGCTGQDQGGRTTASATYTGVDLVAGGVGDLVISDESSPDAVTKETIGDQLPDSQGRGRTPSPRLPADALAVAALVCVGVGLLGGLVGNATVRRTICAAAALTGLVLLVGAVRRVRINARSAWAHLAGGDGRPPGEFLHLRYGFWLAAALLAVIGLAHLVYLAQWPRILVARQDATR